MREEDLPEDLPEDFCRCGLRGRDEREVAEERDVRDEAPEERPREEGLRELAEDLEALDLAEAKESTLAAREPGRLRTGARAPDSCTTTL